MRSVDAVEAALEVLPRKWVRRALLVLVVGMVVTGSSAPIIWFATEKAAAFDAIWTPVFQRIVEHALIPVPTALP